MSEIIEYVITQVAGGTPTVNASDVVNDSSVVGMKVDDALNTLQLAVDDLEGAIAGGGGGGGAITQTNVTDALGMKNTSAAVGDGVANDAVAVQAAVDAAAADSGTTIHVSDNIIGIGTQVTRTSGFMNMIMRGIGRARFKKISTPNRIFDFGLTDAPASTTVSQVENNAFYDLTFEGRGTTAGNDAGVIDNSGNMFAFKKAFGNIFNRCRFTKIGNAALRFAVTGEGDIFSSTGHVPVRVTNTTFYVTGNVAASYTVGEPIGIFNGSTSGIGGIKAAGFILSVAFDGTQTNFELAQTKIINGKTVRTRVNLRAIPATTITEIGKARSISAFQGWNTITNTSFDDTKQPISTNDSGSQFNVLFNVHAKNSGSFKWTSKMLNNSFQFLDKLFLRNCAERVFFQQADKCFVNNLVTIDGIGTNATVYGHALVAFNGTENVFYQDLDTFCFTNGYADGDYQAMYFVGDGANEALIENVIIDNYFFKNISVTRGSAGYSGVINFQGKVKKLLITNTIMDNIGANVDGIVLKLHSANTDSYVEDIIINNISISGSRAWLNINSSGMTRPISSITIDNAKVRGAKGLYVDNADKLTFGDGCDIEYAPYDGTATSYLYATNTRISGEWSVQAGSTVAWSMFKPLFASSITFDNVIIRAPDNNIIGIECAAAATVNIINSDIDTGFKAVRISGAVTGNVINNKFDGTTTDFELTNGLAELHIEGNQYVNNLKTINYTGTSNFQDFTWNPATCANGTPITTTVTFTGARLGDVIHVTAPYDLQGLAVRAYVSTADTVTVQLVNPNSTGSIDLASGVWLLKKDR